VGSKKWVLAVALGILLALCRVDPAHAAQFRVVVRITSEMSRALSDRIRGQTSDLSIELVTVDTGPLEPSLPGQVGSATTVAQVYDADAVVWFDDIGTSPTGEKRLLVMQTKARRLLLREVGDQSAPSPKRPPSESAQLEAASLIVRVAVQAMMQGVMIGVEQARIVGSEPEPKPLPAAQPAPPRRYEIGDTPGALPGLVRVPVAATFERIGLGAAASAGYGYTESILGEGDVHQRLFASVAASLRANEWFALALRLDGRYDWHRHVSTGDGSGWVGEPHLAFRAIPILQGDFRVGAQAGVGFPGEHVPSIDFAATSPELLLFATYAPETKAVALSALVGFRLDRSSETIEDANRLNPSQRVSIGTSDTNAMLFGLGAVARVTTTWDAVGEWTWDLRVPSNGTTALESPMRLDAGARFTPSDSGTLAFQFLFEASPSARPAIAPGEPLVVVEPRFGIAVGINVLPPRASTAAARSDVSLRPIFPQRR
jgi:hypothetical protein